MTHFRVKRAALGATLVAAILAGCGGGAAGSRAGSGKAALPAVPVSFAQTGFLYNAQLLKNARFAGAASVHTMDVDIVPRLRDANGLLLYAQQVADKNSGNFRHFLTPKEIGDRFGASTTDYAAAKTYFQSKGLAVSAWPQRMLLHVSGAQNKLEAALGTHFGWYTNAQGTFLAPMTPPSVSTSVPIVGSPNLVRETTHVSNAFRIHQSQTNGLLYGYAPQQIAQAFDYTSAYRAGYTGAGITVGIIGTGAFSPADVPAYRAMFHVPGSGTATMVAATDANDPGNSATGFAPPPPVTGPCMGNSVTPQPSCNPEDGETQIDTEQVTGLAYDSAIRYYLAYNPNDGCGLANMPCPPGAGIPLQGLGEIDAELQTAIADNAADVISISFGAPEPAVTGIYFNASGYGFEPLEYAALASEGIAIFVSSGDAGSEECQRPVYWPSADSVCVSYPSTDPSVVSVGGTNTPLNSAGDLMGPLTGWGAATTGGFGGSGGGVSGVFPMPQYQRGNGLTGNTRNVPDISLNADANTGVATLMYGDPAFGSEVVLPYGGTSAAAPDAAAMWALVLQACSKQSSCATATGTHSYRLGNPAPYFYKIYNNSPAYASTFYDVLYGFNGQVSTCWTDWTPPPDPNAVPTPCPTQLDPGYQAAKGYDLITGIGAPYARALIHQVVGV